MWWAHRGRTALSCNTSCTCMTITWPRKIFIPLQVNMKVPIEWPWGIDTKSIKENFTTYPKKKNKLYLVKLRGPSNILLVWPPCSSWSEPHFLQCWSYYCLNELYISAKPINSVHREAHMQRYWQGWLALQGWSIRIPINLSSCSQTKHWLMIQMTAATDNELFLLLINWLLLNVGVHPRLTC